VSLQCQIFYDLIIVLGTLYGHLHGVLFLGKSKKLLFFAISIFNSFYFYQFLESGLIADMISYLRTQLEDLTMV
jgi:hypothetical protein